MTTFSRILCLAFVCGLGVVTRAANEAQAVLHSLSVRLHPATVSQLGFEYRLEATTLRDGTINDEIGVAAEGTYLHGSILVLTDPTLLEPLVVDCSIEVPDPPDDPRNGISNFFEVDRPVTDIPSVGEFYLDDGTDVYEGLLDMVWNREAGATEGTCRLRFRVPDFGVDLTFVHTFEVYDYRGTLEYTVEGAAVPGTLVLERQGAGGTLEGPIPMTRIDANELAFEAFALTDDLDQAISYWSSDDLEITLLRGGLRTNYYTILYTADGWPATPALYEHEIWGLYLFDPNDSDQDRIPDLSDEPAPPPPPRLAIRHVDSKIQIDIVWNLGGEVALEQTPGVEPADWTAVQTVTLTNTTHTIEIDQPPSPAFWRARVE